MIRSMTSKIHSGSFRVPDSQHIFEAPPAKQLDTAEQRQVLLALATLASTFKPRFLREQRSNMRERFVGRHYAELLQAFFCVHST